MQHATTADGRKAFRLNRRELATVLAALRYWQRCGEFAGADIQNIADDNESVEQLNDEEIDAICDQLNWD